MFRSIRTMISCTKLMMKQICKIDHMNTNYRQLTDAEIQSLKDHSCIADDWMNIEVDPDFKTDYIYYTRFSGKVRLDERNK